jgi:Zn-dependent peptidase ImmA (M78 family)
MAGTESPAPSPDLLDTVYLCEQRQAWYRDFARENREPSLALRTLTTQTPVAEAGTVMRQALSFDIGERGSSWGGALRMLIENAEALGVLVMVSGIVGSNTHRKLDPREFRGFALADELAPLIFVNGTDTKAAQIFTVAHELAHIWLGVSGVSNAEVTTPSGPQIERWCNQVAAEMLVPLAEMQPAFQVDADLTEELDRLARLFRVSTLVVLRRVHDAGYLSLSEYASAYAAELERVVNFLATRVESSGGNFYNTQPVRVSKRFARAIITSTLEGNTLYRDAFQMLGFKKYSTFNELASRLGVVQ